MNVKEFRALRDSKELNLLDVNGKPVRRVRSHPEDDLQKQCVAYFDNRFPHLSLLLHHSPNGGKRNAKEAAKFKKLGTRAGFPDLILATPRCGYCGLAIELKVGRNKQSEYQKDMEAALKEQGWKYVVVTSYPQFVELVDSYARSKIGTTLYNMPSERL